jgi:CTP synthase
MKYVLVTGGVVSGLGKGVTASSIGVLLKACGHRVTSIKIGELFCFQKVLRQSLKRMHCICHPHTPALFLLNF